MSEHNPIEVNYVVQVIKDGKIVQEIKEKSKSFVRNFAYLMWFLWQYTGDYITLKKEDGTDWSYYLMGINNTSPFGYVEVGTGTTPVSPTDYKLASFLDRKPRILSSFIIEATRCYFEIYADFSFTTDKTITEIGLATFHPILMVRELLPTPISLPANATLRVKYIFNFPA